MMIGKINEDRETCRRVDSFLTGSNASNIPVQIVATIWRRHALLSTVVHVEEADGTVILQSLCAAHLKVSRAVQRLRKAGATGMAVPVRSTVAQPLAHTTNPAVGAVVQARLGRILVE